MNGTAGPAPIRPGGPILQTVVPQCETNSLPIQHRVISPMPQRKAPAGTQSIARTVELLKVVASRRDIGWRLTDLAAQCGLQKSTAYRIVAALTAQRILRQRPQDRRYVAGPLLYELALAVPAHATFRDAVHGRLENLARRLQGIAFLYLRADHEVICIDRVGATNPSPLTGIGTRRVIPQSTFGISILVALPRAEQRELLQHPATLRALADPVLGERRDGYRQILQRSRKYGFGINIDDIVPALTTIAVPVLDGKGRPIASMGMMAPSRVYPEARVRAIARELSEHARQVTVEHAGLMDELHG